MITEGLPRKSSPLKQRIPEQTKQSETQSDVLLNTLDAQAKHTVDPAPENSKD